jgi:lipopolysaccharide/colanic/teichoic acid biosynthesis glycosyltransferase/GNAT superfamily N-acetyltransferase
MKPGWPASLKGDRINGRTVHYRQSGLQREKLVTRPATKKDIPSIVAIHQSTFADFFLTRLGRGFLSHYYRLVLHYAAGILLVSERRDQIEAFACGFIHPEKFYRMMCRRAWIFAPAILSALVRQPSLLARVLGAILWMQKPTSRRVSPCCELSSIAVAPIAASKGVGKALIKIFLDRAWTMGARQVYLNTDAEDNGPVNAYYGKVGFQLRRQFQKQSGRWMNEYVMDGPPQCEPHAAACTDPVGRKKHAHAFRRFVDIACAGTGFLSLLPVFAVLALAIVWDDGFPCTFRQARVGKNSKTFRIWKFRTMRVENHGSPITAAGDRRITRVGAWLRRLKLDELPQLINVLTGDMSLIGPRPEVPEFVDLGNPLWPAVLAVRPGITDVASLLYRDEETILGSFEDPYTCYRDTILPAKLRLNVAYLNSRTLWRDLKLIFLTIRYSLFPDSLDRGRVAKILDAEISPYDEQRFYSIPPAIRW